MYEDNTAAITILRDIVYSGRTKHIDVRLQDVRDQVRRLVLELRYIDTKDQLADLLTKGLSRDDFCRLRDRTLCIDLAQWPFGDGTMPETPPRPNRRG